MHEFSLQPNETTSDNIRRLLNDQVEIILGHCRADRDDTHRSIHEIRKSLKRIRAVLRLIRDEIGYSCYYRENAFYRDLSRELSEIRSLNVLIDSTRDLQSDLAATLSGEVFEPLIQSLVEQREHAFEQLVIRKDIMRNITRKLIPARSRIGDLLDLRNDFRAFKGGLRRIYRQGTRFRDLSRLQPSSEHLHNLRKRMKYLWYHMQILQPVFPEMLDTYATLLDGIGENLGRYHDLEELQGFLTRHPDLMNEQISFTLKEGCEFKKSSILNRTWNDIDSIYSENPGSMARRFSNYWNTYRNKYSSDITQSIFHHI